MTGTTLVVYDTTTLPDGFPEIEGAKFELISTIGMLTVLAGAHITDDYALQEGLTAEVKVEDNRYIIVEYHIDEYGIGDSFQDAQQDLFNSLIDYLASLERREGHLGERERQHLQMLRSMLIRI